MEAYQRALDLRPTYAEAWNNIGGVLVHLRRYKEALGAYEQALHHGPDLSQALQNRTQVLRLLRHGQGNPS